MIKFLFSLLFFPFRFIFRRFGTGSGIVYLPDDHPEMAKAQQTARESLAEFRKLLLSPEPDMSDFAIKVAFPACGNTEHCWVSDLTVENGRFKGRVNNEPQNIKGLRLGSVVTIKEEMISDWSYSKAGVFEGHFTTRVLLPYMNKKMRKQITEIFGWDKQQ